jgi:PAS domain S-box-containing protein
MQFHTQLIMNPFSRLINLLKQAISPSPSAVPLETGDRKQAEENLQQVTAALSHAVEGISRLDAQGRYQMVNQAYASTVGYQPEEMIGMGWQLTVHPDDLDRVVTAYKKMLSTGKVEVEARGIRKDGSIFYKQLTMVSIYDQLQLSGHYCFMKDISERVQHEAERKQAEEALRQSEQRFRAIFDGTFQFIGVLTPEGILTEANRPALDAIAVKLEEVVGQLFWATPWWTHSPKLQELLKEGIARAAKGELVRFEAEHILADGSSVFVDFSLKPIFDDEGQVVMLIPEGRDISDRKQMEESLRESEQRLQSLLDNSTAVIYMKDMQGRYMMINHRYEDLFHLDRNEVKGKTDQEIFPKEIADAFQANDREAIAVGMALEKEEVAPQDDGLHTYLSIKFPLVDSEGKIYAVCGMSTDISDRKQAEVELQNQKQDLVRSNDELQQFAYVASHDLQEPLRMITSYLELLERRYKGQLDARADQFITYAVDGAARMQILINDLLGYSRVGSRGQSFERVDCEAVLQNAIRNLQVAIAENNAVITHAPLPPVNADVTQLTQLFQNLIGNALKFRREDPPQIHIGVERTNGKWLFSVRDNGIGIESQYTNRIFVIFQRLHSRTEYSGTGMGLAICKKIVERHSGKLWVESKPGEGSTFYFTLPDSGDIPS